MNKVKGQTSNWENNEINTQDKSLLLTYDSLQHNNMSNSPTERGMKIMKRRLFLKNGQ